MHAPEQQPGAGASGQVLVVEGETGADEPERGHGGVGGRDAGGVGPAEGLLQEALRPHRHQDHQPDPGTGQYGGQAANPV